MCCAGSDGRYKDGEVRDTLRDTLRDSMCSAMEREILFNSLVECLVPSATPATPCLIGLINLDCRLEAEMSQCITDSMWRHGVWPLSVIMTRLFPTKFSRVYLVHLVVKWHSTCAVEPREPTGLLWCKSCNDNYP